MTGGLSGAARLRARLGGLAFGGDYSPEQWPEDVWRTDIALMRQARVNLVSVGVFAWSAIEPRQGHFTFGWLDRALDLLHGAGISVALATPTASPPPWFSIAHPDSLPVTAEGVRLTHGSRDTYCPSAPAYRRAALRVAEGLGQRYGAHPAVALWHVHNEYSAVCFCDHCADAFRRWLLERYDALDALNDAWHTTFWSQRYSAWEQVLPPRATRHLPNPAHVLDFRRFCSDELLARFCEQRDVLARHAPDVPATTNAVMAAWAPTERWSWAREVDVVTIDSYPTTDGPDAESDVAYDADRARSWSGRGPWLLLEQATGFVSVDGHTLPKAPGRMLRHSLAYIARGSQGALFFQWRQSQAGAEAFHPGMVPHAGPDTAAFREVVALGAVLERIAEVVEVGESAVVDADVAILAHADAQWAVDAVTLPSPDVDVDAALRRVHRALWQANIAVDVAEPGGDLSPYRLVLVPHLYVIGAAAVEALRAYVAGGGQVVVWFLSGIADEHHQVRLGGYPGAFRDLLGVRCDAFHPLPGGRTVSLSNGATGRIWSEELRVTDAEVVATYVGGSLDGRPAVTCRRLGAGAAWYVSTQFRGDDLAALLFKVAGTAQVSPVVEVADGVEVVRRRARDAAFLFVLNHTDSEQQVAAGGVDLVTDTVVDGVVHLAPGGVAVIREAVG